VNISVNKAEKEYDDFLFDIPKAEADLNRALELNPNHVGAIRQMAWLSRLHHKDVVTSLKLMKKLEKLDRSADELTLTYYNYASLYFDIGAWEKGLYFTNKVIELFPSFVTAKAWCFILQNKVQEGIQILLSVEDDSQSMLGKVGFYPLLAKEHENTGKRLPV